MNLSPREVFEIAVQIERNGVWFYERAAELTSDPAARRLLGELAAMERDHQDIFEEMFADTARRSPAGEAESVFDVDEMMLQYIRAMADGHVFDVQVDPGMILTGEESLEEILSTAIGLEKESIVYYAALKEIVPPGPTHRKLSEVIREEMAHVAQLSEQREALNKRS